MSIFDQSNENLTTAGDVYGGIASGNPIAESMNAYINPWQQQVIDNTTRGMQKDRNLALGQVGDSAIASGAFGGSRHGLVESDVISQSNQNIGDMIAAMSQQGFNTAASLGAQDTGFNLAGAGGLANLGQGQFNIGQQINQSQSQQGMLQQQLLQAILGGAGQQFGQQMDAPSNSLNVLLAALQGSPMNNAGTSTSTSEPGMFDYLSLGTQLFGGFG